MQRADTIPSQLRHVHDRRQSHNSQYKMLCKKKLKRTLELLGCVYVTLLHTCSNLSCSTFHAMTQIEEMPSQKHVRSETQICVSLTSSGLIFIPQSAPPVRQALYSILQGLDLAAENNRGRLTQGVLLSIGCSRFEGAGSLAFGACRHYIVYYEYQIMLLKTRERTYSRRSSRPPPPSL